MSTCDHVCTGIFLCLCVAVFTAVHVDLKMHNEVIRVHKEIEVEIRRLAVLAKEHTEIDPGNLPCYKVHDYIKKAMDRSGECTDEELQALAPNITDIAHAVDKLTQDVLSNLLMATYIDSKRPMSRVVMDEIRYGPPTSSWRVK